MSIGDMIRYERKGVWDREEDGKSRENTHTVCLCRKMGGLVRTDTRLERSHSLGWRPC